MAPNWAGDVGLPENILGVQLEAGGSGQPRVSQGHLTLSANVSGTQLQNAHYTDSHLPEWPGCPQAGTCHCDSQGGNDHSC